MRKNYEIDISDIKQSLYILNGSIVTIGGFSLLQNKCILNALEIFSAIILITTGMSGFIIINVHRLKGERILKVMQILAAAYALINIVQIFRLDAILKCLESNRYERPSYYDLISNHLGMVILTIITFKIYRFCFREYSFYSENLEKSQITWIDFESDLGSASTINSE
eukprot:NODE_67_length_23829_cov_0.557059.p15 type:complete len:168 gc:universal NODE_67_length_23829_cov_0.557059:9436-8933(-)